MGKTLEGFPLRAETRLLFKIVLDVLDRTVRQKEETKGIQFGKEEVRLFLFAGDMILYTEESKISTKTLI